MRIVQIEEFFHPDAGYQVNALSRSLVRMGHEVVIVTAALDLFPESLVGFFGREGIEERDRAYEESSGATVRRLPAKRYISGRTQFAVDLVEYVDGLEPDVLLVHGNDSLSGLLFTSRLGKLGYPVVFDSHMLSVASRNRLAGAYRWAYRRTFARKINRHGAKVVRVQDDGYVVDKLGIRSDLAPFVSLGTDSALFRKDGDARRRLRAECGFGDEPVVVYAGKLDESKGGTFFAEAIRERLPCQVQPSFLVVGTASGDKAGQVEELFRQSENRIARYPTQKYPDLPRFYQASDVAVFPAQCSLSFFDVQSCGLPAIVDDGTAVNLERVSHGNGLVFRQGDVHDFRARIAEYCDAGVGERAAMSDNARRFVEERYSYDVIARQFEGIFEEEIERFKEGSING